jgi:trigger factor
MKRKVFFAVLCLTAVLAAAGCRGKETEQISGTSSVSGQETGNSQAESEAGGDEQEPEADSSSGSSSETLDETPVVEGEFALEDCIRLAEYKGLELNRDVSEVTDEDVAVYISSLMTPEEVTDPDATVQMGDTVNLAYEGTRDGVAFE